ncbi:MAG: RNA 2',3'-cyclic phosphodiesterase [Candidatus Aenigmatarchaeota archaeon]
MRLFVAVEIDEPLKDKVVGIQTRILEPAIKLVERQNLHLTLRFIGEVSEELTGKIREALRGVKMRPFEVEIGGVGTFPPGGKRVNVVWLDCKGQLAELAARVEEALAPLGIRRDRGFVSHLTIARVKQRPIYLKERLECLGAAVIGRQVVDRFALKRSTLTPNGPIYEDVELYKLG